MSIVNNYKNIHFRHFPEKAEAGNSQDNTFQYKKISSKLREFDLRMLIVNNIRIIIVSSLILMNLNRCLNIW